MTMSLNDNPTPDFKSGFSMHNLISNPCISGCYRQFRILGFEIITSVVLNHISLILYSLIRCNNVSYYDCPAKKFSLRICVPLVDEFSHALIIAHQPAHDFCDPYHYYHFQSYFRYIQLSVSLMMTVGVDLKSRNQNL